MRIESRSRAIASAPETITIERVRHPHKGGGPRRFDIGEQSQATPRPPRRKRSFTGSQTGPHALTAAVRRARRGAAFRGVTPRRAASRGVTPRAAACRGTARLSIAPALHLLQPPPVALG